MAILSDRMLAAVGMMVIGCCLQQVTADSISIYPSPTESRQTLSLDGVWNFRLSSEKHSGFTGKWFEHSLDQMSGNYERMPVPSSFNDITERREVRDYSGWVWYDRKFFVPSTWTSASGAATLLRFGSVNYLASVYVNGKHAVNHTGGHLPFEAEVGGLLKAGAENHITVAVNNELSAHTLPPGHVYAKNDSRKAGSTFYEINPSFDFFNYAGIHRSVVLSYVPAVRVTDLTVVTTVQSDQSTGVVRYEVKLSKTGTTIDVELIDHEGKMVASKKGATTTSGELTVPNAKLWWPFTMSKTPGYLYTLAVRVSSGGAHHDTIYQKVGIRYVEVKGNQLLVNGKAVYLRGFGKHEDQDIRGRSLDQATILKDFNLIKWIGANSFRTSHYPYSEAIMDEADSQGIIVIDEVPAVGLSEFNTVMLTLHKEQIRELVERDKNRPSVFMFSIANEPASSKHEAKGYFETIAALAKSLDPSKRPITGAISADYHSDQMALSLDVLMINRYFGWYQDTGFPQVIQGKIIADLTHFHEKFKKPVMVSEYGADTIPGMHTEPSFIFSEDFQTEFMVEYHRGFDALRSKGFFIGEHIWNFADFMTKQQISRVGGNKKGIFTRDRQPKTAARLLRCRYWKLSGDLTNSHREGISLCPEAVY